MITILRFSWEAPGLQYVSDSVLYNEATVCKTVFKLITNVKKKIGGGRQFYDRAVQQKERIKQLARYSSCSSCQRNRYLTISFLDLGIPP